MTCFLVGWLDQTPQQEGFNMTALVVYESMFGNTAEIAEAIATGLRESMTVEVYPVQDAPVETSGIALIVAGGPTHAFSMSRTSTRTDAVARGATQGTVDFGLREWMTGVAEGRHDTSLVTFNTRVTKVRHLPGSAARSAARAGRKHAFSTPASSESFYVEDIRGPLHRGELERAAAWGRTLGALAGSQ